MNTRLVVASVAFLGFGMAYHTPAHAVGCLSGGLAGAVAGHMMHHGVLGAIGGCVAGHEYNKHQQRSAQTPPDNPYRPAPGHERGTYQ